MNNCEEIRKQLVNCKQPPELTSMLAEFNGLTITSYDQFKEKFCQTSEQEIAKNTQHLKKLIRELDYQGNLGFSNITSHELAQKKNSFVLPRSVSGYLDLRDLTNLEGLELPKKVGGNLLLDKLTDANDLVLPEIIGGALILNALTSAEGLVLPKKVKSLELGGITSAKGLALPDKLNNLELRSLTSTEGLVLPKIIKGNLILLGLMSAEGLVLPEKVGGHLFLQGLTSSEGLIISKKSGWFAKEKSTLIFPEEVGGNIHLQPSVFQEIAPLLPSKKYTFYTDYTNKY